MLQGSRKKTHQAGSDKGALINCTRYQMPRRNGGKKDKRIIQGPGMWPELAGCSGLVLREPGQKHIGSLSHRMTVNDANKTSSTSQRALTKHMPDPIKK